MPEPFTHIFFDVDSTIVNIEGIDELARLNGQEQLVLEMTERSMSLEGMSPDVYEKRLSLIKPSLSDIKTLKQLYLNNLIPDAYECIHLLHRLGKEIYLVSGGIKQALEPLAQHLGISSSHLFAVDIFFDINNHYAGFDTASPLIQPNGKSFIVSQMINKTHTTLFIGDGLSDVVVQPLVNQFIGVTFNDIRKKVMEQSKLYIKATRFNQLLPLIITPEEARILSSVDRDLYDKGLVNMNEVVLKSLKDNIDV